MKKSVRIFWRIFGISVVLFIVFILLINYGILGEMPSIAELENPTILQATEIYASDGTLMGKYYLDRGNRNNAKYRDISNHVIDALVATEDHNFYYHSGIDVKGTLAIPFYLALGKKRGSSTITQQLALNLFGTRAHNPFLRGLQKIKEWIIAVKLERNFTKEEILTLYLNTVPYSDNIYGIRNASLTFFQKEPNRLNVEEAAVLIGMLNGNSLYNPRINPKAAKDRRNLILNRMVENNFLPADEAARLKGQPIVLNYHKLDENAGLAPYFREQLRLDIKEWCKDHKNPATGKPYNIYRDGLKIYTTINPRMQLYAEEAVARHMPTLQKILNSQAGLKTGKVWKGYENVLTAAMKNSDRWKNMKDDGFSDADVKKAFNTKTPMKVFAWNFQREKDTVMTPMDSIKYCHQMLQTSFMVMDPISGEVRAWVGGIDFRTFKYDHVNIETKRQVGSSIKPFLYCEAIEEAGFTPETPLQNEAQDFPGYGLVPAKGQCGNKGPVVSMATALTHSLNCASAYIMKEIGPSRFSNFLKQVNIQTKVDPYPSMALGACDLSMWEMLWGYTMFPNGGIGTKPFYLTRIEDKNGNVLQTFQTTMKQVISEPSAYTMVKMMQGPVDSGTAYGLRARLGAAEMGGKTGTTNDNSDAWFLGYTPQLLAGTWIGCDDRFIRLGGTLGQGGTAARPIWEYFFRKVYDDKTLGIERKARFKQPDSADRRVTMPYSQDINKNTQPGTATQDNGDASGYINFDTDTTHVPVESSLSPQEGKIPNEANKPSKPLNKEEGKPVDNKSAQPEKKKIN